MNENDESSYLQPNESLLLDVQGEDCVAARALGVHLCARCGAGQGPLPQTLQRLLRRVHASRRHPCHVDGVAGVLVDLNPALTLFKHKTDQLNDCG